MIEQYIPKCNDREVIAWGTGSTFERFYHAFSGTIRYVIDRDPKKAGSKVHDIEVCSKDRLLEESKDAVIVVCSVFFQEIRDELAGMGFENVFRHGDYCSRDVYLEIQKTAREDGPRKKLSGAPNALIIQGQFLDPDITKEILSFYNTFHKDDLVIVSTWSDTSPEILHLMDEKTDAVVLTNPLKNGGHTNVNRQAVSTYNGLKKAKEMGAQIAAKSRSNGLIVAKDIFPKYQALIDEFDPEPARAYGLQNRLLYWSFGRELYEYPYYVDDWFVMGNIEDMLLFWSIPEDKRSGVTYDGTRRSAFENRVTAEIILGRAFCERIGYEDKLDFEKVIGFYADLFIQAERDMEFSYKYPFHPNRCLNEELQPDAKWLRGYRERLGILKDLNEDEATYYERSYPRDKSEPKDALARELRKQIM